MKWWPWTRGETVETRSESYTDLVVAMAEAIARGDAADGQTTAVVETCANLWGRSLAAAAVTGDRNCLKPAVLEQIGRRLVRVGEWAAEVEVMAGEVLLHPMENWSIEGGRDQDSWRYRASFAGPSTTLTRELPASRVMHIRINADPARPWAGQSPLALAATTLRLAASVEQRLAEEASSPTGYLVPIPSTDGMAALAASLKTIRGGLRLVESTQGGGDMGRGAAPLKDWQASRLGADPPEALIGLREQLQRAVANACGVPIPLLIGGDGTLFREAQRQFVHNQLTPVARIASEEASRALSSEVVLRFDDLRAADIQGKSRAYAAFRVANLDHEEAARLAGLD